MLCEHRRWQCEGCKNIFCGPPCIGTCFTCNTNYCTPCRAGHIHQAPLLDVGNEVGEEEEEEDEEEVEEEVPTVHNENDADNSDSYSNEDMNAFDDAYKRGYNEGF